MKYELARLLREAEAAHKRFKDARTAVAMDDGPESLLPAPEWPEWYASWLTQHGVFCVEENEALAEAA